MVSELARSGQAVRLRHLQGAGRVGRDVEDGRGLVPLHVPGETARREVRRVGRHMVCMYVCTVCKFVCMKCMYVCMYVLYVCMLVCMYVCWYVCTVCLYVCMYVGMYVCMYVCMYVLYVSFNEWRSDRVLVR